VRSCNVNFIEPARAKAGCDPGPSSIDHRGLSSINLKVVSTGSCFSQKSFPLGFVVAADLRSCSSSSDSSIKFEWFDRAWGEGEGV
jgi:hypothetical protein